MDEIIVKRPVSNIQVVRVGKPGAQGPKGEKGDPGDPATNLVTSVNGKQGVVVLNSSDVGADASGAAAQALTDAKAYTDQEVGDIDTGVLSVTAGTNITVDDTDPANPIISASGGGGGSVDSVNSQTGVVVLDADDIDDTSTTHKFATSTQLSNADSALQPGDNISELTNDSGFTANTGTVTSVGVSVPTGLQVSGSPVTTSGTAAITYQTGYQGYTTTEASKLSGIEAGADVTDATNVAAAGAVMKSGNETVAGEKTFTSPIVHAGVSGGKVTIASFVGGIVGLYKNAADAHPSIHFHANIGLSFGNGGSTAADIVLSRAGANNLSFGNALLSNVADPVNNQDVATKKYVDDEVGGIDSRVTVLESLPEITEGDGISLITGGGSTSIAVSDLGVVESMIGAKAVSNGKMADMSAMTYKMNATSSTATPTDVSATESPHGQYSIMQNDVVKNSGNDPAPNTTPEPELTLTLGDGEMYEVVWELYYTSATNADLLIRPISNPSTPIWFHLMGLSTQSTSVEGQMRNMRVEQGGPGLLGGVGASMGTARLVGLVPGGRTIGLGWSQFSAQSSDTTMYAGSNIVARRLA